MSAPARAGRPRLTPHQTEVYGRLTRYSARFFRSENGWVAAHHIRCAAALAHLVDKGYAERRETTGPRGGRLYSYRPLTTGPNHG